MRDTYSRDDGGCCTVFGYLTATLATFFIDRGADRPDAAVAGERSITELKARLDSLQEMLEMRLPAP